MGGATAECEDEGQEDQSDNNDDLQAAEPEFEFTEEFDAEVVDANNHDEEDSDEYTRIHFLRWHPILDDQCGSRELIGGNNNVLEPVGLALR